MRFGRSRRCYLLISFGIVLILLFFSHWKTIKILDESHEKNVPPVNEKELQKSGSETDEKANGNKCVLEDGVQTLGHCINKVVLGVAPSDLQKYQPNPMGLFTCLDGELSISWSAVNDDYCDCIDGSDEPGTGACPNMRFFCSSQQQYLPSSRINDGICDCCDGSDEWKKQTVRGDVLTNHNFNIKYAPCVNGC